jgi:hypothetical protein
MIIIDNNTISNDVYNDIPSKLLSSLVTVEIEKRFDGLISSTPISSLSSLNISAKQPASYKLQILLFLGLASVISFLFISIQIFVEYQKFKQLYGHDLRLSVILKNLFKSIYIRILVYKQKYIFFHKGRNLSGTQSKLLKQILKNQINPPEKTNQFINNELQIKEIFKSFKTVSDVEEFFKEKLSLFDRNFYLQYQSVVNENLALTNYNKSAISLNTLNWLVERPQVFYGELFTFYSNAIPKEIFSHDDISVGTGFFKLDVYSNNQVPQKLFEHGIIDDDFCYYTQTVYALSRTSITAIHCLNINVLFRIIQFILNDWKTICESVEKGVFILPIQLQYKIDNLFSKTYTFNRFRQEKLSNLLKPNPKRANELRTLIHKLIIGEPELNKIDSKSIAVKAWPNLEFVITTFTCTLNCQLSLLREYLNKNVLMISHMHSCDNNLLLGYTMYRHNVEGNTQCEDPVFVGTYDNEYFEFIDMENVNEVMNSNDMSLKTIKYNEVLPNRDYEIVVTNSVSIYRYRTGQVVRFTRPHSHSPPLYTVQYKIENLLNIGSLYLNEKLILKKLNLISQYSKCLIVDYTTMVYDVEKVTKKINNLDSTEVDFYRKVSSSDNLSCFILFIEFKALRKSECALKLKLDIGDLFDEYICYAHREYATYRKENKIDKFRIYELKTGAFEVYKNYLVKEKYKRTGNMEFETSRKLTDCYDANILFSMKLD